LESLKREEIRGLFTLSLLALLIVIRTNWDKLNIAPTVFVKIPFTNLTARLDLLFFIDLIVFCWMAYAFSMILVFSDDLIKSQRVRNSFRRLGLAFLIVGPMGIAYFFAILIIAAYIIQYPDIIYVMLVVLVSVTIVSLILRKYNVSIVVEPKEREEERTD